jgi:putative membrane protein
LSIPKASFALVGVSLILLGLHPRADRFTWFLEVVPVLLGAPVLVWLHLRRPWTNLLCGLLALHAVVLMVGGFYTYAEVPWGFAVQKALHLGRNPYDRLGHLMQGFVPMLLIRELLHRRGLLLRGPFGVLILLLLVLGISAAYELVEFTAVKLTGSAADAFMGTQGDPYDSQWDMACALMGGALSLATLGRWQDRSLAKLGLDGQSK